jgi:hypothetical protein
LISSFLINPFGFFERPWGLNGICLSCFCGHIRLVEYFLNANVNVNITDKPSATDNYFGSLSSDHEHKIKMREMHSRVAQDMGMFYYPLHIAIKQDSYELVQLLLNYKQKFDIEIKEAYTKRTSLHIAAGKCSTEVRFLNDFEFQNSFIFVFIDYCSFIRRRSM